MTTYEVMVRFFKTESRLIPKVERVYVEANNVKDAYKKAEKIVYDNDFFYAKALNHCEINFDDLSIDMFHS